MKQKNWKKGIGILFMFLMINWSNGYAASLQKILEPSVSVPGDITSNLIVNVIKDSLSYRGWRITQKAEGKFVANIFKAGRSPISVTISIQYSSDQVSIFHVESSENMEYTEKEGQKIISAKYNGWIKNLENDLNLRFANRVLFYQHF